MFYDLIKIKKIKNYKMNYKMNTNMLIFLSQRYKWNWPWCNIATVLKISQKCFQLVTIKISANGFSHNWANWSASLTASVIWER